MDKKVFDNSNIAESYAGVTTPLTFSFVQYVYQEVYQHFSEMMGVSRTKIRENDEVFQHMVELIGSRIYYNLNSWHKMLTLFPGYQFSSELMESMMGVEKRNRMIQTEEVGFFLKYFLFLPKTVLHIVFILFSFITLGFRMRIFGRYFERTFNELQGADLEKLNLVQLQKMFKKADTKLLARWKVPIANDFAVMISTGLADKLFKKWLPDDNAYRHIRVLTSSRKTLISLDPGNKLMEIVEQVKRDKTIKKLFLSENSPNQVLKNLRYEFKNTPTSRMFEDYLQRFGARMPNELKLESETLQENPGDLILLIRSLLTAKDGIDLSSKQDYENLSLDGVSFVKRSVLKMFLMWSSSSVRRREESRFYRTLIFGYVRNIFLSIGKLLAQDGIIKNSRDIFYLSIEEVFTFIEGGELEGEPAALIKDRKHVLQTWKKIELPRRIETDNSITQVESDLLKNLITPAAHSEMLVGRVASRPSNMSRLVGKALTLYDFDPSVDFKGKILVTCQTDPGWTVIFPLLKGIVVERGGMLSHAAIVARELNIPCLVGVEGAARLISDGSNIELDLLDGVVHLKE